MITPGVGGMLVGPVDVFVGTGTSATSALVLSGGRFLEWPGKESGVRGGRGGDAPGFDLLVSLYVVVWVLRLLRRFFCEVTDVKCRCARVFSRVGFYRARGFFDPRLQICVW